MAHLIRRAVPCLLLLIATAAYGGVPSMNVIVSDSSGKVAYRGATNSNSAFGTANLAPGNYVVQFHSTSRDLKGNQYLVVVAAGSKKVIADAVPGEKFNGGGVAMRVTVEPGLKITGQVATDEVSAVAGNKIKVIDGKRYVWVKARTGTNLADHWEEEGLAAARYVASMSNDKLRRIQDSSYEGSMLDRYHGGQYDVHTHY
jgi:hypothetical protein